MPALHSEALSLVFSTRSGLPEIVYFGARLPDGLIDHEMDALLEQAIPQGGMDQPTPLHIATTPADAHFLEPALKVRMGEHWAIQWLIESTQSSDTELTFQLVDSLSGLQLNWSVSVAVPENVFTITAELINGGNIPAEIHQWYSTVPLPSVMRTAMAFTGRWVHEFQPQIMSLPLGTIEWKNTKGRTSHDHFPGQIIMAEHCTEAHGDCYGFHLGWSGNHCQRIECNQNGLSQYQAGIELLPGEIILKPGESFKAAPLYMTASRNGLSDIGKNFQQFVRARLLNWPEAKSRPVHINTWEALYFNHSQQALDELAIAAGNVGVERFVLDDGWFPGRRNDSAGLGDWTIDKDIYPEGFAPLIKTLTENQLEFGLWMEPEMVNKDSQLYREHPDWLLAVDQRIQKSGRNQWVLDLTRSDVQQYLFECIDALLSKHPIRYIKWDMNRDLSQAGNITGVPAYTGYVRSLYQLLARIRQAHPLVEIESCASGGGRMDYGMLQYCHRFWLSDCNDAHERQYMQQWASLFFPMEILGSHIGPEHSHTTSRKHDLATRAGTAIFGHLGIEWDVRGCNEEQRMQLAHWIELYKVHRPYFHSGIRRPIATPDPHQIGFSISTTDRVYISLFQTQMPERATVGSLRIPSVEPDKRYRISLLQAPSATGHLMKQKPQWMSSHTKEFTGSLLQHVGLPLPVMDPDTLLILQLDICDSK